MYLKNELRDSRAVLDESVFVGPNDVRYIPLGVRISQNGPHYQTFDLKFHSYRLLVSTKREKQAKPTVKN